MTLRADKGFAEFVVDQLSRLGDVSDRRMFGGVGLYAGVVFFGIIYRGRLFFLTDEASRSLYSERGMKPFMPGPEQVLYSYYEVPVDVLEDDRELCEWARRAVAAQKERQQRKTNRRAGRARKTAPGNRPRRA